MSLTIQGSFGKATLLIKLIGTTWPRLDWTEDWTTAAEG
jgi:hypothetical protein